MNMFFRTFNKFKAIFSFTVCCLLAFLCLGTSPAYAFTPPSYPKPSITSNEKNVSYVILLNSFNGAEYDRIGYWDVLIKDEYSTLCSVGDKIKIVFDSTDRPDKIKMQYNPNTMFNPKQLQKTSYYSEALEIEDGFVIKNEHLNPKNKDTMYYLTATWENGNSLEYAFLILTDKNIIPVRETLGEPAYIIQPKTTGAITFSELTINVTEKEQPPRMHRRAVRVADDQPIQFKVTDFKIAPDVFLSGINVISGLSEFDNIELDGESLNAKPCGNGRELFVPIRAVSNALGYEAFWKGNNTVEVKTTSKDKLFDNLILSIGTNKAALHMGSMKKEIITIAKPIIKDGVSYISLRDCMNLFGIELSQNNIENTSEESGNISESSILRLHSFGDDAVYNEALNEYYNGTLLNWNEEANNYIFISNEMEGMDYHLTEYQWATLHRGSKNPIESALVYYIDSSEDYFIENPIAQGSTSPGYNETGMRMLQQLSKEYLPELSMYADEGYPVSYICKEVIRRFYE